MLKYTLKFIPNLTDGIGGEACSFA